MKLTEGGNAFDDVGPMSRSEIEATLKYVSPLVGIPYKSTKNQPGLEDSTLGSAGKTNAGEFGKKETVGDIDIVVDHSKYDFDELVSRLTQKLGPENMGKPMKGLGTIPTRIPVGGDPSKGYVQVDFMFGKWDLLKWSYTAPDPESNSKYKGVYRNVLLASIFIAMRDYLRDPETQELMAEIGPMFAVNTGVYTNIAHWPKKKDGTRVKGKKKITKQEFRELYPEYKGPIKEIHLDDPQDIVDFLFPTANARAKDLDSYEKLKDLLIKYKPEIAEQVLKSFAQGIEKMGKEVPEDIRGLLDEENIPAPKAKSNHFESVYKRAMQEVLIEVRNISLSMVTEAIAKPGRFEKFREKCMELINKGDQKTAFQKPKCNADVVPQNGIMYLLKEISMYDDWKKIQSTDYGDNDQMENMERINFYKDVVSLVGEEDFFKIVDHHGLEVTPESFICSLADLEEE